MSEEDFDRIRRILDRIATPDVDPNDFELSTAVTLLLDIVETERDGPQDR